MTLKWCLLKKESRQCDFYDLLRCKFPLKKILEIDLRYVTKKLSTALIQDNHEIYDLKSLKIY